jgi:hypothetical protein
MQSCPHCGGNNIESDIRFGLSHEVGAIGPKYVSRFLGMPASVVAELRSELCLDCGTIVRLYTNLEKLTNLTWDKR